MRTGLHCKFPASRENAGNFAAFGPFGALGVATQSLRLRRILIKFPATRSREFSAPSCIGAGNFIRRAGNFAPLREGLRSVSNECRVEGAGPMVPVGMLDDLPRPALNVIDPSCRSGERFLVIHTSAPAEPTHEVASETIRNCRRDCRSFRPPELFASQGAG